MTLLATRRLSVASSRSRALRYLPAVTFLTDLVTCGAATLVAVIGRNHLGFFDPGLDVAEVLGPRGPLLVLVWLTVIWASGGYRPSLFGVGTDEYKGVVRASLLTAGLVGIACFLAKYPLSRGFFSITFLLGIPALVLGRLVLRRTLYRIRRRGGLMQRVLIAGSGPHVDEIVHVLRRERWLGYDVVGALVPFPDRPELGPQSVPVLGGSGQLLPALELTEADVVFLAGGALDSAAELRRIAWELEDHDVQLVVAPSVTDISAERVRVRPVGGLPLMHLEKPRTIKASRASKRAFDLVGSALLLVVSAPLFVVAAYWIKLHDGGRVFFGQERTGRDGAPFRCLKFRSMLVDAEERLTDLHERSGHHGGLFKMAEDPRVTRPGRWLRRFSIDELPQLLNVLRGDMSLVGPRPPLPTEVASYAPDTSRRLRVRPGMTGLWQVSGRADLSFEEAIRLDLYYVDNWSMLQDLTILARTVGAVLATRGAY